jgi:hypothetical protein
MAYSEFKNSLGQRYGNAGTMADLFNGNSGQNPDPYNVWKLPGVQQGFYNNNKQAAKQKEDRKNKQNIALNYQKTQEGNLQNYAGMNLDAMKNLIAQSTGKTNIEVDGVKPPPPSWGDKMWGQVKNLGLKDYGDLAVRGLEAYTGFKELDQAEKQHGLAMDTFQFQKAAWNKDYAGRQLAYNTNADNVNAWKKAQGRTDFNKLMV